MKRRTALKSIPLLSSSILWNPADVMAMMPSTLRKLDFGPDFKWGVATSSYQIEGAHDKEGKSPSIWDTFTQNQKNILDKSNGSVSCNFFENYDNDLSLLKQMNFDVFRFSLSWSRIIPQGIGSVNQKGIDFYKRVIDSCLSKGIEPWITLYHWDLPQILEDKGGWTNRDIISWFSEYTDTCSRAFGDRVSNWMVLNEPLAFTALGYLSGYHAPGKKGFKNFLSSVHYTTMCQAEGGRILRSNLPQANIGSTFSCAHVDPKKLKKRHEKAAIRMDAILNRLFLEPALGLGYPTERFKALEKLEKYMEAGDEDKLAFDFDFIGLQNYTRFIGKFALWPPVVWANEVPAEKRDVDTTLMGWEVYPEGIYKMLKQFGSYENIKEIIVTENGTAFEDHLHNGKVADVKRIKFFQDYLEQILKAKNEGLNITGYYVWTLMDNFEWSEGYEPRFGLVYVDFETQQRYIKDSGFWFQEFLAS